VGSYEALFILTPEIDGEMLEKEIDYLKNEIVKLLGEISESKLLGKRKLAYSIKKMTDGFYLLINFTCKPDVIDKLLKRIKHDLNVLRVGIFKKDSFSISEIRD